MMFSLHCIAGGFWLFFFLEAGSQWMGWWPSVKQGGNLDPLLGWAGIPDVNHVHAGDSLQGNSVGRNSMGIEFFRGETEKPHRF